MTPGYLQKHIPWLLAILLLFTGSCSSSVNYPSVDLNSHPWLFQRDGKPIETGEKLVELIAVGDLMPERQSMVGDVSVRRNTVDNPFSLSTNWLNQADLTMGNLEGVFALESNETFLTTSPVSEPYRLVIPKSFAKVIRQAGFDLLGLANNHALDQGSAGLGQTIRLLEKVGIQSLGINSVSKGGLEPYIQVVKGIRLAFLAVNAVPIPGEANDPNTLRPTKWNAEMVVDAIQAVRSQVDVVIVFIHWGYEYELSQDPAQEDIARRLSQAGADLVLGHHPHVVQGTQMFLTSTATTDYRLSFVVYSLGNFVFDQSDVRTQQGLTLRVFLDQQGVRAVQALPVQSGLQPYLLSLDESTDMLERIQPELPIISFSCKPDECQEVDQDVTARAIISATNSIDLTGDGNPETVVLKDNRVNIYEEGHLTWQSPVEWQVLDMALGDPNNDGRFEVVLALMKEDDNGNLRSHPFIIGFRGGIYRQVWGGSAVSEPIQEIELLDVDGDQIQELLVLDELIGQGKNTVGIWKWNGWGFNLQWRSTPGHYQDLQLTTNGFRLSIIP